MLKVARSWAGDELPALPSFVIQKLAQRAEDLTHGLYILPSLFA
jgi:hypothetical protein